ncbi:MAG TPA: DUF6519 domain-containing protein [Terracidiphilus sp.]|jgi:hypothetical protein|nr:DUF6519 domain-containing protein [Terracidiphilus sp.]
MKGDFSRIRFNPAKQYTSVLKQQGRVDLDADANEQCFIDESLRDTINQDVIGPWGGPEDNAGFAIEIRGEAIWISPGRYYVHGLLVENPRILNYDDQPYLIEPKFTAADLLNQLLEAGEGASLGFVLEVWQRLATALDDPCLTEPALGQADTTARLQTVWRVVASVSSSNNAAQREKINISHVGSYPIAGLRVGSGEAETNVIDQLSPCCQSLYNLRGAQHLGQMGASAPAGGNDCGCQPIAAAGYQGLENQLYRVEIQTGGDLTSATFKWSRENGSVVTQVTSVGNNSTVISVASLGPDANLGFQAGQWVELTDDSYLFGDNPNQPGNLFQIDSVNQATLQVTMTVPVFGIDTTLNARMRRWDQSGASASSSGIPVSDSLIPLENGIEVNFRVRGEFQPGDYWTIPARTANGQIDWPPCGSNGSYYEPAAYMPVYQAPLACVGLRRLDKRLIAKGRTPQSRFLVNDCRLLFPPLIAVNAAASAAALHVSAISWTNDDILTIDTLLKNGLSVTFDQATTCPWGGGNFQVYLEPPMAPGVFLAMEEGKLPGITKPTFASPLGTDCFLRTVMALDPPWGVTVSGNQVSWITPVTSTPNNVNYGAWEVLVALNTLLGWLNPIGFARVRVRLIGGAIYGDGVNGNIYLDGQSLGETGSRALDSSESVNYNLPSGNSAARSDYEGWFYLAPTVFVTNVVIQGVENNQTVKSPLTALKVIVDSNNQLKSLQVGETATITLTGVQALITLSYPSVAPTTVTLVFTGTGAGSVVTIASSVTIPAGQKTFPIPINIISNPGGGVTDTVTLIASISAVGTTLPCNIQPQLSITGMTPPVNYQ